MTAQTTLSPDMTMGAIMAAFPGARRALFAKYHIGGCQKCAFSDDETLAQLCERNENIPVSEVLAHLEASQKSDDELQISAQALSAKLQSGETVRLIDVRSREEHEAVNLPGSVFLTQELMQEIFGTWDKATEIVLYCHKGVTGLDMASYFVGHGFEKTICLAGGLDRWSVEVDPTVSRYRLE
jgi:rhodanese-related sulfurtransferase